MNRPDIAAFMLGLNTAWILTTALLMTLMICRRWTSDEARSLHNGILAIGGTFGVGAIVALAMVTR